MSSSNFTPLQIKKDKKVKRMKGGLRAEKEEYAS
jgi:hypothetical protein